MPISPPAPRPQDCESRAELAEADAGEVAALLAEEKRESKNLHGDLAQVE